MSEAPTRSAPPGGDPTADPIPSLTHHPGDPTVDGASGPFGPPAEVAAALAALGYELLEEVGGGGMGVVYRAREAAFDRDVAIKILQHRFPPNSPTARRFLDEARITGQLQHPAIPPVHRVGTLPDGRPFLVMKLIKGSTLADLLVTEPDDRGRFVAVFAQVCQAVAYAHARRVIHRDLKPANVMVGAFAEVQVMDWGLAKVLASGGRESPEVEPLDAGPTEIRTLRDADAVTQAGSVLGTPSFMSPEQAGGEVDRIDQRSDVFGLGAVLCMILTGKPPYTASDPDSVRLLAIRGQTADALARLDTCGADPELVALCKRCLSADRDARPRDAGRGGAGGRGSPERRRGAGAARGTRPGSGRGRGAGAAEAASVAPCGCGRARAAVTRRRGVRVVAGPAGDRSA
jgi:serine/threonine protein kinase